MSRYYDPSIGQFISEDSYRGDGEAFWHLYAYCDGDPVNYTDRGGNFALSLRTVRFTNTWYRIIVSLSLGQLANDLNWLNDNVLSYIQEISAGIATLGIPYASAICAWISGGATSHMITNVLISEYIRLKKYSDKYLNLNIDVYYKYKTIAYKHTTYYYTRSVVYRKLNFKIGRYSYSSYIKLMFGKNILIHIMNTRQKRCLIELK